MLLTLGYVAGVVVATAPVSYWLGGYMAVGDDDEREMDVATWGIGFILALFWPVILAGAVSVSLSRRLYAKVKGGAK